ncbi:aminopeptidase P family N-terminal domain-containing protein [Halobellus sp. GM3]|uniref:aminopeptidase P family N-terminal domain-containing protein n=1 Tax=Halobellus sp. GM3 TaxID=3458410 RepID=UPI00403E09B7
MKSREPVITRGRDEWDQVNMPPEAFRQRVTQVRDRMADVNIDAMLVYGRGDRDGHLCYLTNLINKVPNWGSLAIITPESEVLLYERSSRTQPVIERSTWIETVESCDSIAERSATRLEELNEQIKTIGTIGFDAMTYSQSTAFENACADYEVRDSDAVLWELRKTKTDQELDQLRRSARINTEILDVLQEEIDSTVSEAEIETKADYLARLRGAQDFRMLLSNPAQTESDLRPAESHTVRETDVVVLYLATRFEGYWSELIRPVRFDGRVPDESALAEAELVYDDFVQSLRTGSTPNEVRTRLETAVSGTDLSIDSTYALGNGIGLGIEEPPAIQSSKAKFSNDMTLAVRVPLRWDDDRLLIIGDTIAMGAETPAVLTH